LTKHRKAFRWGSRQGTDKGEVSTPSSEDDVDNTDRSKQSSSTPVPQKDPVSYVSEL
uniref:Zinc finger protein 185 (LIM domain) n=1 Tax=Hymenolepis diminuta TaxID=6216 RepID=A0A0R3SMC2_HYMDI